jgi:uncharacterized peroxidase-related enzyme
VPHIALPSGIPGIRSLLAFRPETAGPLTDLASALLRAPNALTAAERELIAAHVSARNQCEFCHNSHAAIAACYLGDEALVAHVVRDPETAPVSDKMKALLALAGRVQESGKAVRHDDVARARNAGATDTEIHDTVLIAAAFSMYNRYVDGLGAWTPDDSEGYRQRARLVTEHGYAGPPVDVAQPARG